MIITKLVNLCNQIKLRERASYSYCARSWRKKIFSAIFYFGILPLKNWLRLWRQFKLNMKSCEPADEEELPTFSSGMEFLTPQKERKEKDNKEQARPVSSRFANHRVENVIKQLVHTSAVRSSRYEALGSFEEYSRS